MFFKKAIPLVVEEMYPWHIHEALIGLQHTNIKNLLIQSNGGSSISLMWAIDHLINANLCTIGRSTVDSLAVPIFLCGKKRVAFRGTSFFVHKAGFMYNGKRITSGFAQMKSLICHESGNREGFAFWQERHRVLEIVDKRMIQLIANRTQISTDMAAQFLIQEKRFSVKEARECGIVHEIIPTQQVNILSEYGVYEPLEQED